MANISDLTRKEQVLAKLRENINQWVDGPDLANEAVGGSEGLRRLRDLKAEGYLIQERAHPERSRAIHQYRLVAQSTISGGVTDRPSYPPAPHYPPSGYDHAPGPTMRQVPTQIPKAPQEDRRDWHLESAVRNEWRCEFWIRQPKQRIIGTIALDMDRSRWFWSIKRPKYHGKYGNERPEKILASGTVPVEETKDDELIRSAAIRAAREEAKFAVEHKVRELKEGDEL
jgi:hypothetical protein